MSIEEHQQIVTELKQSYQNGDLISRADLFRELTIDAYGMFDAEDGIVLAVPLDIITHEIHNAPSIEPSECDTCKHNDKEWDSVECDGCCGNNSHYEPSEIVPDVVCVSLNNGEQYYFSREAMLQQTEQTNTLKETETKEHDDLISRADAVKAMRNLLGELGDKAEIELNCLTGYVPSVSANSNDLIIKNGKGIQDGLYNIKDGELFKYKAKGGTVRAYKLAPSVSAERVGCDSCIYKTMWQEQEKAETLDRHTLDVLQERFEAEELKAHAKSSGLKEHAVWNKAIRILEEYMEEGDNDND